MNNSLTGKAASALELVKGGSYSNAGNVLQDTLYDTLIFPTSLEITTFFNVPIGTSGKTEVDTNLTDPSKLPNGQTFLVTGFRLALLASVGGTDVDSNTVIAAFYNAIQNSFFKFKIAGRDFERRIPGSQFLPTVSVAGLASAANAIPAHGYSIASGCIKAGITPIPLGQLVTFSATMNYGSGLAAVRTILNAALAVLNANNAQLRVSLEGVLTRAI